MSSPAYLVQTTYINPYQTSQSSADCKPFIFHHSNYMYISHPKMHVKVPIRWHIIIQPLPSRCGAAHFSSSYGSQVLSTLLWDDWSPWKSSAMKNFLYKEQLFAYPNHISCRLGPDVLTFEIIFRKYCI